MRAKFIDVKGVRTRYLYEGSGPPLVIIHGSGAFADNFYKNIDPLATQYTVYAPDVIGHGFTQPVAFEGLAYPAMVDHLCNFVDTLGLQRFHLAGWSMGGLLASLIYFRMPSRVQKLILISSGSCFNTEEEISKGQDGNAKNVAATFANLSVEAMRKRHMGSVHPKAKPPEEILMSHMTSYAQPGMKEFFERMATSRADINALRPYRVFDKLEQIKVPTLVVAGKDDPRANYASAVAGAKRIPQAQFIAYDECGHRPFYEHHEQFNKAVLEFLAEPQRAMPAAADRKEQRS
ncbi:MAG: alpha/beta hydrolase [Dehalococcoidia bacterium]|nr:alpha/beta hydrolase [Dehalococcoidia bacterium]